MPTSPTAKDPNWDKVFGKQSVRVSATVRALVESFLDDWHYRVLHSNMTAKWDTKEATSWAAP